MYIQFIIVTVLHCCCPDEDYNDETLIQSILRSYTLCFNMGNGKRVKLNERQDVKVTKSENDFNVEIGNCTFSKKSFKTPFHYLSYHQHQLHHCHPE